MKSIQFTLQGQQGAKTRGDSLNAFSTQKQVTNK